MIDFIVDYEYPLEWTNFTGEAPDAEDGRGLSS